MKRLIFFVALMTLAGCKPEPEPGTNSDFAVLAQTEAGFEQARPGVALEFPRDHGPHPGYRIEWWYLTANLQDDQGREYGAQWTLFRTANRPLGERPAANPWQDPQVFMAHMAITTPVQHKAFQRYARGGVHDGLARAGVTAEPFSAWLDDWTLQSRGPAWLPLDVRARQGEWGIDLQLGSEHPLVLQGEQGFSQKHPAGGGSYYYSQPFLQAAGDLMVEGQAVQVSGEAWLDREWSSQFLQADQGGWDWFALHLDSGEKLMLFRLRALPGSPGGDFLYGALLGGGGEKLDLDPSLVELRVFETTELAGRALPLHWQVTLPEIDRRFEVKALHPGQWMDVDFAYWEGVVLVSGDGPENTGRGYLELTGYPVR